MTLGRMANSCELVKQQCCVVDECDGVKKGFDSDSLVPLDASKSAHSNPPHSAIVLRDRNPLSLLLRPVLQLRIVRSGIHQITAQRALRALAR